MESTNSRSKRNRNRRGANVLTNKSKQQKQDDSGLATIDSPLLRISDLERFFGPRKAATLHTNDASLSTPDLETTHDKPTGQRPLKSPLNPQSNASPPQSNTANASRARAVPASTQNGTNNSSQSQTSGEPRRAQNNQTKPASLGAGSNRLSRREKIKSRGGVETTTDGGNPPSSHTPNAHPTTSRRAEKQAIRQTAEFDPQRPEHQEPRVQDQNLITSRQAVATNGTSTNSVPRVIIERHDNNPSQSTLNGVASSSSAQTILPLSARIGAQPTIALPPPLVPALQPARRVQTPHSVPPPLVSMPPGPRILRAKPKQSAAVLAAEQWANEQADLWNPPPPPRNPPTNVASSSSAPLRVPLRPPAPFQEFTPRAHILARILKTCSVCLDQSDEFPLHAPTTSCTHSATVCAPCLEGHISHAISSNGSLAISCPDDTCRQTLEYSDVRIGARKNKCFERYETLLLRQLLQKEPNFIWCKNSRCDAGQLHESGAAAPIVNCRTCRAQSCFTHDVPWHTGLTCVQYDAQEQRNSTARTQENRASEELINRFTKTCPNSTCSRKIEKISGCDHMTCRRPGGCGHEFCWICLAAFDPIRRLGNHLHNPTCSHYFPIAGASLVNRLNTPNPNLILNPIPNPTRTINPVPNPIRPILNPIPNPNPILNPNPNANAVHAPERDQNAAWGCVLM